MQSTGIVRKLDPMGRLVLPRELRRTLDINENDPLAVYVDGNTVLLRKYEPECIFCGEAKDIAIYKGKNVCPNCMKDLRE